MKEKIKVSLRYRIGYLAIMLIVYLLFLLWDYHIRDNKEWILYNSVQWGVMYAVIYVVFIGRMKIEIDDRNLICKPFNSYCKKTIRLDCIDYVIEEKSFIKRVVVYYNNGQKVILHPEEPKALVEKLKKINRY